MECAAIDGCKTLSDSYGTEVLSWEAFVLFPSAQGVEEKKNLLNFC